MQEFRLRLPKDAKESAAAIISHQSFCLVQANRQMYVFIIPELQNAQRSRPTAEIELRPVQQIQTSVEFSHFIEVGGDCTVLGIGNDGNVALFNLQSPQLTIEQLQYELRFEEAIVVSNFVTDFKLQQQKRKQLVAQQGLVYFNAKQFDLAFAQFLAAKIDPLCVLYMYSDPTFELINQNVAKQVMSMEQLLQNLPEDFQILMVCFPPGQPVDETMYFAVEQLKCYFVSWRGEVIDYLGK